METSNSSSNSSDWLEIVNTNTDLEQEIEAPNVLNLQEWKNIFERYPLERKEKRLTLYFNGGDLDWGVIQSERIPKRNIVEKLLQSLDESEQLIHCILLQGATGEGKTTALMQTVYQFFNKQSGWKIYWRNLSSYPDSESLYNLVKLVKYVIQQKINNNIREDSFLFVSDRAEQIFDNVYKAIQEVDKCRHDAKLSSLKFRFLLCCRTTEWEIEKKNKNRVPTPIDIQNPTMINLSGLSEEDARAIATAWVNNGCENNLKIPDQESIIEKTTQELYRCANLFVKIEDDFDKTELKRPKFDQKALQYSFEHSSKYSSFSTGTFFGAILAVRFDQKNRITHQGLENHLLDLMNSFNNRKISIHDFKTKLQREEEGILLTTFAYIAAFEAEGQYILEKKPLAHSLSCTEEELDSIIQQLGEEVPISGVSNLLFTRHPKIAEVAFNLLNKHLFSQFTSPQEIDQIYLDLLNYTFIVYLPSDFNYIIRYQYDSNHAKNNLNAALRDACTKIENAIQEQH